MFWRTNRAWVARAMTRVEARSRVFSLPSFLPVTSTIHCLSIGCLQRSAASSLFLLSYPLPRIATRLASASNSHMQRQTRNRPPPTLPDTSLPRDYEASLALLRAPTNQAPRLPNSLLVFISVGKSSNQNLTLSIRRL